MNASLNLMTRSKVKNKEDQAAKLLNLTKVPFVYNPDEGVQKQGNEMGIFLQSLAKKEVAHKTWIITKTCFEACKIPATHPLFLMAKDIADLIDSNAPLGTAGATYSGNPNGYHNSRHMQEVVLNAMFLLTVYDTRQAEMKIKLDEDDKALLLFAALSHDLGHDGKTNREGEKMVPFRMEKLSVAYTLPFAGKYMSEDEVKKFSADFETIVCATDIGSYQDFFNGVLAYYHGEEDYLPDTTDIPAELLPLASSEKLTELAAMLCDADIFSSIAYNFSCCWEQSLNLASELSGGVSVQAEERALRNLVGFHENSVRIKSEAGQTFLPNFTTIRSNARTLLLAQQMQNSASDF